MQYGGCGLIPIIWIHHTRNDYVPTAIYSRGNPARSNRRDTTTKTEGENISRVNPVHIQKNALHARQSTASLRVTCNLP